MCIKKLSGKIPATNNSFKVLNFSTLEKNAEHFKISTEYVKLLPYELIG